MVTAFKFHGFLLGISTKFDGFGEIRGFSTWRRTSSSPRGFVEDCDLINIGYFGPSLTWTNSGDGVENIRERLDRDFCNRSWNEVFALASLSHIARAHSDHCPSSLIRKNLNFRWQVNGHLGSLLLEWSTSISRDLFRKSGLVLMRTSPPKFTSFMPRFKNWNKCVFGNIFIKKKRCLARIQGVQNKLTERSTKFLVNLERKLIKEYNQILCQEESFWCQESRIHV